MVLSGTAEMPEHQPFPAAGPACVRTMKKATVRATTVPLLFLLAAVIAAFSGCRHFRDAKAGAL
jgi:hypothetical protein